MTQTRMTKQRAIILETLKSVCTHPTADELYGMVRAKLPKISLGTVYRNLDMLAESGDILLLEKTGSQKRFDGDTRPHFHVRCDVCGIIGDVFTPIALPDHTSLSVEGFASIHGAELTFTGVCERCAALAQ